MQGHEKILNRMLGLSMLLKPIRGEKYTLMQCLDLSMLSSSMITRVYRDVGMHAQH